VDLYMEDGRIGFVIDAPFLESGGDLPVDWIAFKVITGRLV